MKLSQLFEPALELVFPRRCVFCNKVTGSADCCQDCNDRMRRTGDEAVTVIEGCPVYSVFYYRDRARSLFHDFKFRGRQELAEYFSGEMTKLLRERAYPPSFDVVTYLPMPEERERGRGYNQAKLLALGIAGALGIPCSGCGLEKTDIFAQHDLHLSMRLKRVDAGLGIANDVVLPESILLVDDLCTSGATVAAAIRLLRRAGAKKITVVTVFR